MKEFNHRQHNIGAVPSVLLGIQAEIAALREKEAEYKAILIEAAGGEPSAFEDHCARSTVSFPVDSVVVDWKAVAEKAGASRQLIRAHTKTKKNSPRVCTKARSTEPKKVA